MSRGTCVQVLGKKKVKYFKLDKLDRTDGDWELDRMLELDPNMNELRGWRSILFHENKHLRCCLDSQILFILIGRFLFSVTINLTNESQMENLYFLFAKQRFNGGNSAII